MTTPDKDTTTPDESQDESKLTDVTEQSKPEVDYGILVYVDTEGKQGIQVHGRQNAALDDLLSLLEVAQRKLHVLWDSQHNPTTQAMFREMDMLKKLGLQNNKTLEAITQILDGLRNGLQDIHNQIDLHTEEPDAAETKVQI
jgi:hypothetical protein